MNYFLDNWTPIITPIAIIFIALLVISIVYLRKNRALAEKLCYYILGFTFLYKTFHYVIYCVVLKHPWVEQIPCEISQLAYFLCPLAFFSGSKWLRDGGAFTGIIAGGMQLIAITVAPYRFAEQGLNIIQFFESTVVHYFVLWGGLVQICCIEPMKIKNVWRTYGVFLLVILWGVLASFTWRYETEFDRPANIGFVQRCDYLPDSILQRWPWLEQNHLFIIPYVILFMLLTGVLYLLSYLCMRNVPKQEPSMYGMGWVGFKKFMKGTSIAPKEE